MAARDSMADIITRLRGLIHDPAGDDEVFSDDDLQGYLDDNRTDINYMELTPRETITAGGSISYLEYHAPGGWWEETVSIVDNNYEAVSPATDDYRRGVWTFAESIDPPLYIVGSQYNIHRAAVAALEEWLSQLKFSYDFTADGASFKRSQQISNIEALIERYNGMAGPQVMKMTRSDSIK